MTKRKTHEDFVNDVYNLVGDEYTVVGKYTLSKNKVEIRHNECGKIWEVKANNFMNGNRCKHCRELSKIKGSSKYKQELFEKYQGNIIMVEDYKTCDTRIKHKCLKHNHTFLVSPTSSLRDTRKFLCPKCVGENSHKVQKKSVEKLISDLKNKHNDRILLEGEYVNTHTKTLFRCTECAGTFKSEPNQVIRLSGCPYCSSSKGELLIQEILKNNNITFEREKKFEGCKHKRMLPFDFYIPEINTLIEFDGIQHTKPIEFFGGYEAFEETKLRDDIKTNYAKENKIHLVRIPYTQSKDTIEEEILKLVSEVKQRA